MPALTGHTPHRRHVRSPVDVLRLIGGFVLVVAGLAFGNLFDSALLGLSQDGMTSLEGLPGWVSDLPPAALASGIVLAAGTAILWSLLTTRFRRATLLLAAFGSAAALSILFGHILIGVVDADVRAAMRVDGPLLRYRIGDEVSPTDPLVAGAVAMLLLGGSYLAKQVSNRLAILLAVFVVVASFVSSVPAVGGLVDVGIGVVAGSAILLIFGRHDLAPQEEEIKDALARIGLPIDELKRLDVDARGSSPWMGSSDGNKIFVKALGRDERSADLLFRMYRWGRYRNTGDHRPFVSLRRAVEHEALVALQAKQLGIETPQVLGVAVAGVDGMVVAYEALDGSSADAVEEIDNESLREIWKMVSRLHQRRIAHRDLRLANIFISNDGAPHLIDFGFSELAASDQLLGTDVAELLVSTAAVVGPQRAVLAAHEASGVVELERALPWLQAPALSGATREAAGDELGQIRTLLIEECGIPEEAPVRLDRVDTKTLFLIGTIALSAWFLLPQLADIDNIWAQVKDASPWWAFAAVVFSIFTYGAATASLLGAIPQKISFWPAFVAQLASSFANRVTPARVGGVATNVRYLQKQGIPVSTGVAAVGINAVAGGITHVSLIILFTILSSSSATEAELPIPSPATLGFALVVLASIIVISIAIPLTRRLLRERVLPHLQSGWASIKELAQRPTKLAALFGGSAAITLLYMAATMASLEAFGSTAGLPILGLLFLTGSAVANAAPTPGGIGAAEAALIAAFSTVEKPEIVIPAVFLYRFVTFWLPIPAGWAALTWLRRHDRI